jgi:hypothetical protein|tara:strand:+ start:1566 stop:2000 length:435 start_codon:yes stop_codon:yes gene_type:complete
MTEITQKLMDEKLAEIRTTTNLINTPETDNKFGIAGTFYIYSVGMKDNYDLPDLEMRGIPGMLINAAAETINDVNAYRLLSDKPVLVGQILTWQHGQIRTEQGDDWDGGVQWKAEDMIRLTSAQTTIDDTTCECCEAEKAGLTE